MHRLVDLAGCFNFRDLGGYHTFDGRRVRWRRIFRSDGLHHLTSADVARLRDEIGLGTVIDLRSTNELRREGRGLLEAQPHRFHHVPLFEGVTSESKEQAAQMDLTDRYVLMAEFAHEAIGRVVNLLADATTPAVFHCAAGKDRTGVISAILLGLLGVDDDVIVGDYAATQDNLDAIVERLMASEGYKAMLDALPPDTMHANPATMEGFLRRMRTKYGDMDGYVRAGGVGDDAVARLRERMLEDA
jgi:protein tyrosine/serine phosphatase